MCYQDLLAMQEGIVAKKPLTCKSKFKIYAIEHAASFDRLRTGRVWGIER
jgi:hypothetical protein